MVDAGEPDWYIVYCHLEPYIFENARKLRDAIERMNEAGKTVPEGYRERLVELETTTKADRRKQERKWKEAERHKQEREREEARRKSLLDRIAADEQAPAEMRELRLDPQDVRQIELYQVIRTISDMSDRKWQLASKLRAYRKEMKRYPAGQKSTFGVTTRCSRRSAAPPCRRRRKR
jgi:hypothetical protein